MNRLINQTIEVTPPVLALLGDAVAALPDLLEQLEVGTAPTADIAMLTEAAAAFADGALPAAYAMQPETEDARASIRCCGTYWRVSLPGILQRSGRFWMTAQPVRTPSRLRKPCIMPATHCTAV